jgi:hypothetical protein
MSPEIFPSVIEAKCSECGHIWPYARHEAFACPFCNARLESVEFTWDKRMAFFQGRRWKEINKAERKYWERLAAAPSVVNNQQ